MGSDAEKEINAVDGINRKQSCRRKKTKKQQLIGTRTLGTTFWKNIQEFPLNVIARQRSGILVNGKFNWLVSKFGAKKNPYFIVSLDFGDESYQEVLLPDYGVVDEDTLHLGVLRDFLCIAFDYNVWVIKEYGNKESWTKLFTFSYMQNIDTSHAMMKVLHIFEDDQVPLKVIGNYIQNLTPNLIFCGNDTGEFIKIEKMTEVCVESLISPCS